MIGYVAHGGQHGVDALDRHDADRIVALFEEAVRRQERGDPQPLPVWGHQDMRDAPALAQAASCPPALADAPLSQQQQAVRSLFNKPGDGPFARFLDASLAGDTDAARKAARDLCATPEATAWLQSGRERLSALREPAPGSGHANEAEGQALRQHAAIPPEGRG